MENKIDQQKFNALQELSQIEMALSDARVAFENFKKTEEEYLKQREIDVSTKLDKFIETLSDSFESFSENKETFERIKSVLSSFSEKAVTLTAEIKEISAMLTEKIANADILVNEKMTNIEVIGSQIRTERKELNDQLLDFNDRLKKLGEAEMKLNQDKIAFTEKWKQLVK